MIEVNEDLVRRFSLPMCRDEARARGDKVALALLDCQLAMMDLDEVEAASVMAGLATSRLDGCWTEVVAAMDQVFAERAEAVNALLKTKLDSLNLTPEHLQEIIERIAGSGDRA